MMFTTDFVQDMTVYSTDGILIGHVYDVLADTPHGLLPLSRHLLADYGPIRGTAAQLTTPHGLLHVRNGKGYLEGHHDLYFPLDAVAFRSGTTLRVHLSAQQSHAEYCRQGDRNAAVA